MRNLRRTTLRVGVGLVALGLIGAACGSSSKSSTVTPTTTKSGSPGSAGLTGAGYTTPTAPSGTRISGGTVYFAESPSSPPDYIFPMYSSQFCGTNNINQLNLILYRPLYWYGDNYSPTVDYNKSVANAPVFSNNNTTVSVTLKPYKWSNGETVTGRDVVFWMNVLKADPAAEWCGYVPGYFPDNVTSVTVSPTDPQTVIFQFNKSYNPTWLLYNELSQIYPMPLAWDRTSLSQPAPTADNGHLTDTTKTGAAAVYKFLDAQSKNLDGWSSSPIWSVVDGPFSLKSFTTTGEVTMVPNPDYSGSPKASIAKLVEVPFTDEAAEFDAVRAGGTGAVSIFTLPSQYVPQVSTVEAQGYTNNMAASYSFNFFPLNEHNPKMGPVFSQGYFRQAFQHLIDQPGWINAFLHNTAVPTYGPIPSTPTNPLISYNSGSNPYPFSVSAASQLLTSHGWKVVPGGATSCIDPGTGANQCGAGIPAGKTISFNLDYESAVVAVASEMNDLAANAKRIGINIELTSHPFNQVYSTAVQCTSGQPTCNWTAENWGAGWIFGPDYFPTGEDFYLNGSIANYSNYSDPTMTNLIQTTLTAPASQQQSAMSAYASYAASQVPVVYEPTSIGTFAGGAGTLVDSKLGGYAAQSLGWMDPEDWYLTS